MNPIIKELEKELKGKIIFEKIDVDSNPHLAQKYNVMSIPTYVVLVGELEVGRITGATSKENFLSFLNKYLPS
jgi:thioredoxin 1